MDITVIVLSHNGGGHTLLNGAIALGFTHPKTPCASTLHYCFNDLDIVALEKTLSAWAADVFATTQEDDKNAVVIDGKTLCGSLIQDAQITHQLGITLTQ